MLVSLVVLVWGVVALVSRGLTTDRLNAALCGCERMTSDRQAVMLTADGRTLTPPTMAGGWRMAAVAVGSRQ